jgi:hypothetical protein
MTDSTPHLTKTEKFNQEVREWSIRTRNKMRRNAPVGLDSRADDEKLSIGTEYKIHKAYGVAKRVTFDFPDHGIYVHYGVGNGYVREGGSLKRGRKLSRIERLNRYSQGHSAKQVAKMRHVYSSSLAINRTPVDWFDVEIRVGIQQLADLAQEYYGDRAMNEMLRQMKRSLIEKK